MYVEILVDKNMQIILIGVTDKDCNGDYLLSYFKVTLNLDL